MLDVADLHRHKSILIALLALAASGTWASVSASSADSSSSRRPAGKTLTLAVSDSYPAPGERVTFTGTATSARPGQRVLLQRLARSGWSTVAETHLSSASTFAIGHTLSDTGLFRFRAAAQAGSGTGWSYSRVVRLDVRWIHKIKHIVIIMQENRSFDQYFGTYPGARGIPGLAGNPGELPCVPDPRNGGCSKPFHDTKDVNFGGPHGVPAMNADMNCSHPADRTGCDMNGFVGQSERGQWCTTFDPTCSPCRRHTRSACLDVMGYHTGAEIPNYWTYARDFVLQDRMFVPNSGWSLPSHLFMVSEWSARCASGFDPFSCTSNIRHPNRPRLPYQYAWTDLTYLLHKYGVSWAYYVFKGTEPDCTMDMAMTCAPVAQRPKTLSIWNPLPAFTDVAQDGQLGNIQSLTNFYTAAQAGNLPAVSWITPNGNVSEHPPAKVSGGQTYVTGLVNAIMQGPDWKSTAIFISWDDWGGFYDQVVPPIVDKNGYGLRVPGLVISPYARRGFIDGQILSHDAYVKFIEYAFLGGQQLNPLTDGRPDPRPTVREASPLLGNLVRDFNFRQPPRAPVLLPVCPTTDLRPQPVC